MTKEPEVLDRAIDESESAISSSHCKDINRAAYLSVPGLLWDERIRIGENFHDFERAVWEREQASAMDASPPIVRLMAAEAASRLLIDRDRPRAKVFLENAVKLLPLLSPRTLQQSDQQYNVSSFSGLTSKATSLALDCGDSPYTALQLIETGRDVLANLRLEIWVRLFGSEREAPPRACRKVSKSPRPVGQSSKQRYNNESQSGSGPTLSLPFKTIR